MELDIQKIDLQKADDDIREKFLDYQETMHAALERDEILRSREHRRKVTQITPAKNNFHVRYVALVDDKIVGSGYAGFSALENDTNSDALWMYVAVIPEYRNKKIGSKLLDLCLEFAAKHNRTKIETGFVPTDDEIAGAWTEKLGMKLGFSEKVSRLYRENINWDYMQHKEDELRDSFKNYTFHHYDRNTFSERVLGDDEFAEQMADFYTEADNLLPREEAEWNDVIITREDLRVRAENYLENLRTGDAINFYCYHNDQVIAMSGTYFANDPPIIDVGTGLTVVRKAYQRQGLATYLKIMVTRYFDEHHNDFKFIQTENAGSNKGMLHINQQLGYSYQWDWNFYQGNLEVMREYLKQ